jgi:putative restriction endonuclease
VILFRRPQQNVYIPFVPSYIVAEDQIEGFVKVAVGEEFRAIHKSGIHTLDKGYVHQLVKRRVHQPEFRARVISAYEGSCAVCHLKHRELLDAAHIIPDSQAHSTAEVSNGLSLCKIHHAAYDRYLLGIDPNYKVHINKKLLLEKDGPMLKHGLQEMHGVGIKIPHRKSDQPNREALDEKFVDFMAVT